MGGLARQATACAGVPLASNPVRQGAMSWITITWSAVGSACLTLAMVHLLIWCKQTDQRAYLLFSVTTASAAAIAACELLMMRAQTPQQFGMVLRWMHLPVFCGAVSMVGFVRLDFRTGRAWLGYAVCGLRLLALIVNFWSVPNLNYKQITALRHLRLSGGETISVAQGVPNPWTRLGELSSLLLLAFIVDASVSLSGAGVIARSVAVRSSWAAAWHSSFWPRPDTRHWCTPGSSSRVT